MTTPHPPAIDIGRLIHQIPTQYPFVLVDRVIEHDPAGRLVALKNVTGSEEYFEGHFPSSPVMPGVLIMESLAQAAGLWLLHEAPDPERLVVHLVGIDDAKFRRPVLPGDQLRVEIKVLHRRGALCRVRGDVRVGEHRAAEANLLLQVVELPLPAVHPSARVAPGAVVGPGARIGPYCVVGPQVRIGPGTILESHVVVDGDTRIGADNRFFPFSSIGLAPQDLKYRGERTRLEIGDRNVVREFVTIHCGTDGGGGVTSLGSDNLLMTGVHIAHDCRVGDHVILANSATLGGHVEVADWAIVSAFSGVHQFCRVGRHAFIGGYTVVTKDTVPFSKVVGNRASIYGVNSLGLQRREFTSERVAAIKTAFRLLIQNRLHTTAALAKLESEGPSTDDVRDIIAFIRSSSRGVILKRRRRLPPDEES